MTNFEMAYKTTTIGVNTYLQSSGDRICMLFYKKKRQRNFTQW